MERFLREPINGLTHFVGAVLSVFALIAMLIKVYANNESTLTAYSVALFGISMILLYSASALYHSAKVSDKVIKCLKRLDHSMIFVLITGSYAPFCLVSLYGRIGFNLFATISVCAVVGIIFKICWVTCPKWLSSVIYIGMGWLAVFIIYPISQVLPAAGLFLLVLGGIMYTIGGVIYALKSKQIKVGCFGNHEIFHLFIMAGTLCHFISVFKYII